jgi:uncharacterized protein (DUF3084 family)
MTEIAGKGAWRVIKIIIGIATMVGAVLLFVPALNAIETFRYVIAGLMALVALIICFDSLGIERVLQRFRQQIVRLSTEVDRLEAVEQELENTNKDLQGTNEDLKVRTREYGAANKEFKEHNLELNNEVRALQESNRKLVLIEKNAQNLIQSLMQAGDNFTQFGPILQESVGKMEDVNTSMERILYELASQKFDDLDANDDGVITQEELMAFAKRREESQKKDYTQ